MKPRNLLDVGTKTEQTSAKSHDSTCERCGKVLPMRLEIGDRVKLRADASLARHHPALVEAVGVVGAVVKGPQWARLTSLPAERAADLRVHIRFAQPRPFVLLNAEGAELQRVGPAAG